jgi:asparagine synthetase B (glutamine-hydrolysing)
LLQSVPTATGTSKIYLGANTTVKDILNRTAAKGAVFSMATYEVLGRDPFGGQPLLYSL